MQYLARKYVPLVVVALVAVVTPGETWPPVEDGLLFAWSTSLEPARVLDESGAPRLGWQFTPTGRGRLDHNGALVLGGGGFDGEGIEESLARGINQTGEFTLWLTLQPGLRVQSGEILRLGDAPLLRLSQQEDQLRCSLRSGSQDIVLSAPIPQSGGAVAIGLSCSATAATLFVGGATTTVDLPEAIRCGGSLALSLGQLPSAKESGWEGAAEGLALFARALEVVELEQLQASYNARIAARKVVPVIKVRARLAGKSTVTPPRELAPYTQGLCVFRYDILETLEGEYMEEHAHVAHWSVLDQALLPFTEVEEGTEHVLTLELLDDNPQLASENLSDDIVDDFSLPYFYDAGGWAIHYETAAR